MTEYWQLPRWTNWLSAIRAAPDDDVTRLVVADWLDEHGYGERAGLIRAECHNARLDRDVLCHQPNAEMGDWCNDTLCPKCGREIRLFPTATPFDYCGDLRDLTDYLHGFEFELGFLARVSAPLSTLYGGECQMGCEGSGRWAEWGTSRPCPACHGTGRTVGILPDLLRREPVLRVEVTDRQSMPFDWYGARNWSWFDQSRKGNGFGHPNACLPIELFSLLQGGKFDGRNYCFDFPAREAAADALSAALIEWGLGQIREGVTR